MNMLYPTDVLSIESWSLLITLILLFRYYLARKWKVLTRMNIPHDPPSLANFGNVKELFGKRAFIMDNENKKKFGPIWGFYMGTSPSIVIHDPDMLRQIYIKEFPSFPIRQDRLIKINGKELNNSLISINGKQWKRVRTAMTPAFSTAKLKQMMDLLDWCIANTLEVLNRKQEECGGKFDPKIVFPRLSLDILCSTAFSRQVNSQDDSQKEPEISKQAKLFFGDSVSGPFFMLCMLFPWFEKVVEKFELSVFKTSSLNYFKSMTNYIMKEKAENPDQQNRVDLMRIMLDAQVSEESINKGGERGMTKTEIIGNSLLMILAAYENVSTTMGFLTYNLAQHQKVQSQLQNEISEMIERNGKMDYEGINGIKLLDMCINETLRLYNPTLRNARYCEKEVTINGFNIPAGTQIAVPTYALGVDPDYWEQPLEFRPERMRDISQIDPLVFQPWGGGPRNCIGMRFALMEIKMTFCTLLSKFTFIPTDDTPKPPLELKFRMSVRAAADYHLQAVPRREGL